MLSNLVLDEWDQELERRGHLFMRYADDSNIYVPSERAGKRVMASLTAFITHRLKLRSITRRVQLLDHGSESSKTLASRANHRHGEGLRRRLWGASRSESEN